MTSRGYMSPTTRPSGRAHRPVIATVRPRWAGGICSQTPAMWYRALGSSSSSLSMATSHSPCAWRTPLLKAVFLC